MAFSGHSGVRGDDNDCYEDTEFIASFPASAVYVTAVGGVEESESTVERPVWQTDAAAENMEQDVAMLSSERYVSGKRGYALRELHKKETSSK